MNPHIRLVAEVGGVFSTANEWRCCKRHAIKDAAKRRDSRRRGTRGIWMEIRVSRRGRLNRTLLHATSFVLVRCQQRNNRRHVLKRFTCVVNGIRCVAAYVCKDVSFWPNHSFLQNTVKLEVCRATKNDNAKLWLVAAMNQ